QYRHPEALPQRRIHEHASEAIDSREVLCGYVAEKADDARRRRLGSPAFRSRMHEKDVGRPRARTEPLQRFDQPGQILARLDRADGQCEVWGKAVTATHGGRTRV